MARTLRTLVANLAPRRHRLPFRSFLPAPRPSIEPRPGPRRGSISVAVRGRSSTRTFSFATNPFAYRRSARLSVSLSRVPSGGRAGVPPPPGLLRGSYSRHSREHAPWEGSEFGVGNDDELAKIKIFSFGRKFCFRSAIFDHRYYTAATSATSATKQPLCGRCPSVRWRAKPVPRRPVTRILQRSEVRFAASCRLLEIYLSDDRDFRDLSL